MWKVFMIDVELETINLKEDVIYSTMICPNPDSNRGHSDLQSDALPTELLGLKWARRDSNA